MGKKCYILDLRGAAKMKRMSARRQKKIFQGTRKRGPTLVFIDHDVSDLAGDVLGSMNVVGTVESPLAGSYGDATREQELVSTIASFLAPELSTTRARRLYILK